jgi:hypothetical protein
MSYDPRIAVPRYEDWRWAGHAVNPPGAPVAAVLTEVTTNEWHWVFGNNAAMAMPDQQIPHDYAEGTDIVPHIHFAAVGNAASTGTWTMRFFGVLGAGNNVAPEAELVLTAAVNIPINKARRGYTVDFSNVIPGAGRTISSMGTFLLSYAKTSGDDMLLRGFDGHYIVDGFGSRLITAK